MPWQGTPGSSGPHSHSASSDTRMQAEEQSTHHGFPKRQTTVKTFSRTVDGYGVPGKGSGGPEGDFKADYRLMFSNEKASKPLGFKPLHLGLSCLMRRQNAFKPLVSSFIVLGCLINQIVENKIHQIVHSLSDNQTLTEAYASLDLQACTRYTLPCLHPLRLLKSSKSCPKVVALNLWRSCLASELPCQGSFVHSGLPHGKP